MSHSDDAPGPSSDGPPELGELLAHNRERLRIMVALRIDRRLAGRLDPSDVVQEAFLEAAQRWEDYRADPKLPPYLWLRLLTAQRLLIVHRHNLAVQARDAGREARLEVSSEGLAARLADSDTSPSGAAARQESQARLREAMERLDPDDREILALRHFEELSNAETAQVLDVQPGAASQRYYRALKRLRDVLADLPGGLEGL